MTAAHPRRSARPFQTRAALYRRGAILQYLASSILAAAGEKNEKRHAPCQERRRRAEIVTAARASLPPSASRATRGGASSAPTAPRSMTGGATARLCRLAARARLCESLLRFRSSLERADDSPRQNVPLLHLQRRGGRSRHNKYSAGAAIEAEDNRVVARRGNRRSSRRRRRTTCVTAETWMTCGAGKRNARGGRREDQRHRPRRLRASAFGCQTSAWERGAASRYIRSRLRRTSAPAPSFRIRSTSPALLSHLRARAAARERRSAKSHRRVWWRKARRR